MIKYEKSTIPCPPIENVIHSVQNYSGISLFSSNTLDDREYTGFNPFIILTDKELHMGDSVKTIDDPLKELDKLVEEFSFLPKEISLLGYMSYDFKDRLEEKGLYQLWQQEIYHPFYFVLYEYYLLSGRNEEVAMLWKLSPQQSFKSVKEEDLLGKLTENLSIPKGNKTRYRGTSQIREAHIEKIDKTVDYIKKGHIYQANITRAVYGDTEQSVLESAMNLYRSNRISYGVIASIPGGQVMSTSPELFFKTHAGKIMTSPIKGTIQRDTDPVKDEKMKRTLLHSEKDKAELAMIVDLLRNDISRVCEPGSVKVPHFPNLMTLENVYHLYADVMGELLSEATIGEILKRIFPGGSITGCPKIRACQIIDELEEVPRGLYTGSFGRIGFDGTSIFNIMIRSLFRQGNQITYNVGGGITLLSEGDAEFEETEHKGRNIWQALNMIVE